jgi:3alpha(or 20beta)-hydroxysteroid dehydrogenase
MDLGLADKVVVITGAGRGLGLAMVRAFLAEGAHVHAFDLSFPAGAFDGLDAARLVAEVRDCAGPAGAEVPRRAMAARGRLDILVLNAARHAVQPLAALREAEVARIFATNLHGPAHALAAFAAAPPPGGGAAVLIGSTATHSVQPGEFAYRAAKAGLKALAGSAALELAPLGVRVNLVSPGGMDTDFAPRSPQRRRALREIPLGREADPAEVAAVAVFVASPVNSYMTGAEVLVDGGLAMRPIRPQG